MDEELRSRINKVKSSTDYFEKARLLNQLLRDQKISGKDLARELGIKPSALSHILRLNKIPELIKDGYDSELVSITHLFIISRLSTAKKMIEIYEKVLGEELTTQQTELLVREALHQIKDVGEYLDKEVVEKFVSKMSGQDIDVQVLQSRLRAKVILKVKGNAQRNSEALQKIIKALERLGTK